MSIYLSVVIPAYNEEERLEKSLHKVASFLSAQSYLYEVLIVENGSTDKTFQIAKAFANAHSQFRVIQERERGKGRALRRGFLEAKGRYRFMCDVDLSMPIEEIVHFLPPHIDKPQIVIASREAQGAVRYNEPIVRHWGGRVINFLIQKLILPGLNDTQCGFKLFEASIAEDLFTKQQVTGWSMDVEVLFLAQKQAYQIVEVPIQWYYSAGSKVHPIKDSLKLVLDILTIKKNYKQGQYAPKEI